ncbi:MAG: M15 family metallopeptidase [Bacteroidaceae bacterium]|nr:M15 family metallopeptidase [Bacteroidaceae bacterium]
MKVRLFIFIVLWAATLVLHCQVWQAVPLPDSVFLRMKGRSYGADCTVARSELRYLQVEHWDADGVSRVGELVCNKAIAQDLLEIFRQLYDAKYPIGSIRLIDDFDASDELSMTANNTSCFNFRFVTGTRTVSKHGLGMAIDINPLYNPYIRLRDGHVEPAAGRAFVQDRHRRTDIPMKIDANDLCCKLFKQHGFKWGGDWKSVKDYQHFEK